MRKLILISVITLILFSCKKDDDDNQPPTAKFTCPSESVIGHKIMFNASASDDPDGDIIHYSWNFGDEHTQDTIINQIGHIYSKSGIYFVELRVFDAENWSSSCAKYIIIRKL